MDATATCCAFGSATGANVVCLCLEANCGASCCRSCCSIPEEGALSKGRNLGATTKVLPRTAEDERGFDESLRGCTGVRPVPRNIDTRCGKV